MFTDLPPDWANSLNPVMKSWLERQDFMPQRISAGVYWTVPGFANEIQGALESSYSFSDQKDAHWRSPDLAVRAQALTLPSDFGVCHQPKQALDYYSMLAHDPRPFAIFITKHPALRVRSNSSFFAQYGTDIAGDDSPLYLDNGVEHYLGFHLVQLRKQLVSA